ncbi:MAG: hypothetical protein M1822_008283 [Bathelium mastoideum]|nr:MAG: hypothetical protein M1822_008283 [Bathelium mastoideum]
MNTGEKALDSVALGPSPPLEVGISAATAIDIPKGLEQDAGVHSPSEQEIHLDLEEIPQNWPLRKKWPLTILVNIFPAQMAIAASIHTAAIDDVAAYFRCSETVSTLAVTTFLLGFATGPLIFSPLSEIWGRNPVYKTNLSLFVVFNLACALAPNLAALLIFRFFAAFFGSPSVTNSGGSITDMWAPSERSVPLALYTAASFLGPVVAPIAGGFISQYTTWRWNYWVVTIISGTVFLAMLLFLPETYPTALLRRKCRRAGVPPPQKSLADLYVVSLRRPIIMLLTEPILASLSLYMALVFAILFMDFTAYPLIFTTTRHWSPGLAGLAFLGIGFGMALATAASPLLNRLHAHFVRRLGGPVPEARLPHLLALGWLIPAGLFWFAWTAEPPRAAVLPVLAGVPFGVGFVALMLGIMAYLTDCYGRFAASALAANAVLRALLGATFPLFARGMYERLGTPWATSVLGFVSLAMTPLPWVFWKWGPWLRKRSKFHQRMMEES